MIIGRKAFDAISAVEGKSLTAEQQTMLDEFDRLGLSNEERRHRIMATVRSSAQRERTKP